MNTDYRLDHASADALTSILSYYADYGSSIHSCRLFTKSPSKTSTQQSFSAALSSKLHSFTSKLAYLQTTYANLETQTISLLSLQNLLHKDLELFHVLKSLVTTPHTPSSLLTKLHDFTSQANAIGKHSQYKFLLDLFLPALETYLRPLHTWMIQGELNTSLYPEFFITSTITKSHPHAIYDLLKSSHTDIVVAPRFLLHVVHKVLAAGKTTDFLKQYYPLETVAEDSFSEVLRLQDGGMVLFEQVFESAMEGWVNRKYEIAAGMLRSRITEESELWRVLEDVHGVYCMLYHGSMTLFTELLFQKVICPLYPFIFFLFGVILWVVLMLDGSTDRVERSTCPYRRLTRIVLIKSLTVTPIHSNSPIMRSNRSLKMSRFPKNTLQGCPPAPLPLLR